MTEVAVVEQRIVRVTLVRRSRTNCVVAQGLGRIGELELLCALVLLSRWTFDLVPSVIVAVPSLNHLHGVGEVGVPCFVFD